MKASVISPCGANRCLSSSSVVAYGKLPTKSFVPGVLRCLSRSFVATHVSCSVSDFGGRGHVAKHAHAPHPMRGTLNGEHHRKSMGGCWLMEQPAAFAAQGDTAPRLPAREGHAKQRELRDGTETRGDDSRAISEGLNPRCVAASLKRGGLPVSLPLARMMRHE